MPHLPTPLRALLLAASLLAPTATAQIVEAGEIDEGQNFEQPVGYPSGRGLLEETQVELAVSDEFAWFSYRTPYNFGDGHVNFEILGDEDENFVGRAMLTRYSPAVGNPQVSVGLGVYGGYFDIPGDGFVLGIPIAVGARYKVPSGIPLTASASVGWAPDITTFEGGDEILDFEARLEVGVSDSAAFFVGYRKIEFEIRDFEPEIGDSIVAGVRLSL